MNTIQTLKKALLPKGTSDRTVLTGILKGLHFEIDPASQTQIWLGLQERELYPFFKDMSQGIETALDVGAADGFYTLFLLHRTPAKKVIAFEPQDSCLTKLKRNLALNPRPSATQFVLNTSLVGTSAGQFRLDNLELSDGPCLVKIDTEGAERDILNSAKKLLSRSNTRWIIETHSEKLEKDCIELLEAHGFKTQIIGPAWWRIFIPELRVMEHNRWLIAQR